MFSRGWSTAPRLADFRGRDNNFNLLRIIAATLVVAAHATGPVAAPSVDPLQRLFGIGAGDLGVDIFFVLSGFLVTKSFAGKSLPQFAWARITRIFPGLWVSTLLTVLWAGLYFSDVPFQQFLSAHDTLTYFVHNFTMLPGYGSQSTLEHVTLPEHMLNLPLWTLPHELQMYMLLAVIGAVLGLRIRYIALVVLVGALAAVAQKLGGPHLLSIDRARFVYFFFAGSAAYLLRKHIVLSGRIVLIALAALAVCLLTTTSMLARDAVLVLVLPYVLLWCAYIPGGWLRLWNRMGDYSYGIYIYGFPVQMALATSGLTNSMVSNFLYTLLVAFPIAAASWHLLEQHALRVPLPGSTVRGAPSAARVG